MKTLEGVIQDQSIYKTQVGDIIVRPSSLIPAIRQWIKERLPTEEDFVGKSFEVPKLDRDIMKDPWFTEGIKIGIRETLKAVNQSLGEE